MEENIAEWGKVFVLGLPVQPPRRTLLLKIFTPARPARPLSSSHTRTAVAQAIPLSQSLARQALPLRLRRASLVAVKEVEALVTNYLHPRVIDPPLAEETTPATYKPLVPALLLTAVSGFTAWYVYRVTGQQLHLQTQVRNYAESLQQEKLARISLTAPQTQILTFEGNTPDGVQAKIFWQPESQTCQVYLHHLPTLTPQQFFQFWFFSKDERFLRARSFSAENGAAELNVQLPATSRGQLQRFLVSVEANARLSFPEGQILVKGRLP